MDPSEPYVPDKACTWVGVPLKQSSAKEKRADPTAGAERAEVLHHVSLGMEEPTYRKVIQLPGFYDNYRSI